MEYGYDFLFLYDGNSSFDTLSGGWIPSNISSHCNQMGVVFTSDNIVTAAGFFGKIHINDGNCTHPGEMGYCTRENPCKIDEGHCETNDQCGPGLKCGFNNCPPGLGFQNGTNCCFSRYQFCGEFITIHDNGWTLQTPNNTLNRYVADVECNFYFNTGVSGLAVSMTMNTFEVRK